MFDDKEVVTQETTESTPESPEIKETAPVIPEQAKPVEESANQKNIRALRDQKEKMERERNEAVQKLQAYEKMQPQEPQTPEEENLDVNVAPDDWVEGKHISKVSKKIKKLEDQLRTYQQQTAVMTTEARLKSEFTDFDKVVSVDNIKSLKETYPELAYTIDSNPDIYTKAKAAYTMIKKLGINNEPSEFEADKQKAQDNAAKPRPLASVSPQQGESPLSRANAFASGLTDELKTQLFKEMQESRKNY